MSGDDEADTRHERYVAMLRDGRRRRSRRRLTIISLVVIVVLAGTLALRIAASPGALSVPTDPRLHADPRGDFGQVAGVLHASRSGDRACFWVVPPPDAPAVSKVATDRYYLVMPSDWSADDSLRLLHAFHQTVATPGESVVFLGAPGDVSRLPGCPTEGVTFFTAERFG